MTIKSIIGAACTGLVFIAFNAGAATFSFTGAFSDDDDVLLFDFTVGATSTIALRSYGYAGGTQADGNLVAAGGFDPILVLFDREGNFITKNDDDATTDIDGNPAPIVAFDAVTGYAWDTYLETMLDAGDYTVAVTQYNNRPLGSALSDGFTYVDDPSFTFGLSNNGCSNGQFCDTGGNNRTNEWAFDVLNVESATQVVVPVPAAFWLFGSGIIGLVGLARSKA